MCGIIGSINIPFSEDTLNIINHRGPDTNDKILLEVNTQLVTLGHTRLSIVDLSEAGAQPMTSQCGNYIMIFNGEVYNHEDLRKEIKGIEFRGHSDTETVLYYLIQKGVDGLRDLNGIFALALLDIKKNDLLLVRDHFGIKPLYYYHEGNEIAFSSELRGVLKLVKEQEIDVKNLYTFLRLRYNPSPQTLFKSVKKLEPGHYLSVDLTKPHTKAKPVFFSYKPGGKLNISEGEALERYDYYLRRAIKRQLMADVPISILLSGGVDSALLTKIAREVSNSNFQTYTAGYSEKTDIDEIDEALVSAKYLGTPHKKVIIEEQDFVKFLPKFISIIEEPLGSQSIVPMYYLSEHIHKDGYKVALSGQGVDEPWAGYPKYNPQQLIQGLSSVFSGAKFLRGVSKHDQYRRAINAITTSNRVDRFIEIGSVFDGDVMAKLIKSKDIIELGENTIKDLFQQRFELFEYDKFEATDALTYFDARMNLPDDLLLYTDKISMHHSLEVRVPYLDIELTRYVESLPFKYKVNYKTNKILHKKLSEKYLSPEIIYRKKKHFATPRKMWFKGEVGKMYEKMIIDDNSILSDVIDKTFIIDMFKKHREGKVNYEKQLYLIICTFLWVKEYTI